VTRELALLKVTADATRRTEILQISDIFRAKVIDMSERTFTLECTGDSEKIDALTGMLKPFGIRELVRTGKIALARGARGAV
jgi:acetolactate synthase-1/3 small subunit